MNLFITIFGLIALKASAGPATLHLLENPLAKCMDGSLGGFYVEPGTGHNFIIHLQGGGECASETACRALLKTALGSSKYFQQKMYLGFLNDANCTRNPTFCEWNHVFLPYCSQDLFSGQRTANTQETFGVYFSGAHIFNAVLDALEASFGLGNAQNIILSGDSAGGIATWLHVDRLAARVPHARVANVPFAGFYFYAYPYTGPNKTQSYLVDFTPSSWPHLVTLWNSTYDESCGAALRDTPWACMLANYSHPYVTAEGFIIESQTDKVVLTAHDSVPSTYIRQPPELAYVQSWATNMTNALKIALHAPHNSRPVFSPACFIHTEFSSTSPLIYGQNYHYYLSNWFFNSAPYTFALDTCGLFCNPTCAQP